MTRAMRYMNGYVCLAGECPDTCCASWRVPVDEAHYEALKAALSEPADRELFERAVEPVSAATRRPQQVARLALDEERKCLFLDEELTCSLHRRFGEDVLPDGCATFPRLLGRVGERHELAGSISCPEVARRALPTDDGTDLVEADPATIGRGAFSLELRGGGDPATRLDTVRDAMYEILSTRVYPLDSRLFALAHFGYQLHDLVAQRGDPAELAAAVEPYLDPAHLARLHEMLSEAPADGAFGLSCVLQLLTGPLSSTPSQRFADIAQETLPSFSAATDIHGLWQAYLERREALADGAAERVDRMVFNYARHCCMAEWYSTFPGLRMFVQQLLLRVATQRFLLIGHPSMAGLAPDQVDELGVQVFYAFARAIERNALVSAGILDLTSQTLPTFFHAAPLLRV